MKKNATLGILATIILTVFILGACSNPTDGNDNDGSASFNIWDGSTGVLEPKEPEGSVFEIKSAAEFAALTDSFSFNNDQAFELKVNIDLAGKDWTPIKSFKGTFNGNGHTIKGLKISAGENYNAGLFGNIIGSSEQLTEINDLKIELSDDGNLNTITDALYVGGLAGQAGNSVINNVSVSGGKLNVSGNNETNDLTVGGIVGNIYFNSTISNSGSDIEIEITETLSLRAVCVGGIAGYAEGTIGNSSSHGNITVTASRNVNAGGIVGQSNAETSSCKAYGNVTINTATDACAGGITGYQLSGELKSCNTYGNVIIVSTSNEAYAGGIVGKYNQNNQTIDGCHSEGDIKAESTNSHTWAGGIIGLGSNTTFTNSSSKGEIKATVSIAEKIAYAGGIIGQAGIDFTKCSSTGNIIAEARNQSGNSSAGGIIGSGGTTFTSCSATGDIKALAEVAGSYAYAGGITGTANNLLNLNSCTSGGTVSSEGSLRAFAGGLIGNGNFYIEAIEKCYATGVIEATATDIGIDADTSGIAYAGGLIGNSNGQTFIKSSYATKAVSASAPEASYAGGIAGYISNQSQQISQTYASGAVTAKATKMAYAGGLIALIGSGDEPISECYTTGDVNAEAVRAYAGGLIGSGRGPIEKSYSTGNIMAIAEVEALAGGISGYAGSNNTYISLCYTSGTVTGFATSETGGAYVGGIIGGKQNGAIISCFTTGNITADAPSNAYVGGIIASPDSLTITSCYTTGEIIGGNGEASAKEVFIGGIAGNLYGSSCSKCAAINPSISGKGQNVTNVGRIVGNSIFGATQEYNIANEDMVITENGIARTIIEAGNSKDGLFTAFDDFKISGTYTNAPLSWDPLVWSFPDDGFPQLKR